MLENGTRNTVSSQKRAAIQAAGTRVFLRMGYEAASMDAIAGEAGVAKQTLYNHFLSKETLFKAIIDDLAEEFVSPLETRDGRETGTEQILETFGRQALAMMLRPTSLALHRVLVAEASRFPDLAETVFNAGPAETVRRLSAYLQRETARGRLLVTDPTLAAEQFLGMLTGHIQLRALFGIREAPPPEELEATVRYAVGTFLAANAPELQDRRGGDASGRRIGTA